MRLRNMRVESTPKLVIIPMIDVIFFLLVFFMISALYMMESHNIPVNLPGSATASKATATTQAMITLTRDNIIYFDKEPISIAQLAAYATQAYNADPDKMFIIQADRDTTYGQVVAILDELKRAGIQKVSVATEDKLRK